MGRALAWGCILLGCLIYTVCCGKPSCNPKWQTKPNTAGSLALAILQLTISPFHSTPPFSFRLFLFTLPTEVLKGRGIIDWWNKFLLHAIWPCRKSKVNLVVPNSYTQRWSEKPTVIQRRETWSNLNMGIMVHCQSQHEVGVNAWSSVSEECINGWTQSPLI